MQNKKPTTPQEQAQKKLEAAGPFFAQWIKELQITPENNLVPLQDPDRDAIAQHFTQRIFEEDKHGNVVINYWNLYGQTVNYWEKSSGRNSFSDKVRYWKQTRYREPKPDGPKYLSPKGQGTIPFLPWPLVKKYTMGERIDTLYLTEGAKKAFYAAELGVDVVGLTSITTYREKTGELYADIRRIIEVCHVQHVVILWDADCTDISMKDLARSEELTKRPRTFFRQVEHLRKLIRGLEFEKGRDAPRVHFMHPKRGSVEGNPKGLDDILVAALAISPEKQRMVVQDLVDPCRSGPFFFRMEVTSTTLRLGKYFRVIKSDADGFYELHAEKIGQNSFYFYGNLYTYVSAEEGLDLTLPAWAKDYLWIGDNFFMKVEVPSAKKGFTRFKLLSRKKETVAAVTQRQDFLKFLPHHVGFTNQPSHFDYRAVVEMNGHKFYNRYFPFEHVPEEGPCQTILEFVKHIFGTVPVIHPLSQRAVPRYEMGLDYIQLLLEKPTQILPVLILFSTENNTGKSTFCKLLSKIFKNNAIFISNSDLQSDFNSVFADKLVVMCEETLLERKKDTERIKALSTADEITVNEKNVSQYTIDFFTKFIFASNHKRMININAHDERFWILQVPKATKENPHLLDEMTAEIPAFLNFLKEREIRTEQEGRMWFHPATIRTTNFFDTVEVNEPGEASNVRTGIAEMFDLVTEDTIEMPMKYIKEEFFSKKASDKWVAEVLKDHLGVVQLRGEDGAAVYKRGQYKTLESIYRDDGEYGEREKVQRWKGRPYVFHRNLFQIRTT